MNVAAVVAIAVVIVLLILFFTGIKVVQQYERGVVFRLGRLAGSKGPGVRLIIPFIDQMRKIDTRVVTIDVPAQEVLTRDNVTTRVNAVVFLRVMDPERAIIEVQDYRLATYQMSQTTLRSVLGQHDLDSLLAERDKLNQTLRQIIDEATDPWGVKVSAVEIKDVEIDDTMKRSMAAQAEAERVRRAKIIHAEGEAQAAEKLLQAARLIGQEPAAIQLRYLQTLTEIATDKTNTLVFPLPMDLLQAFLPKKTGPQP